MNGTGWNNLKIIYFTLFLLCFCFACNARVKNNRPLIWDMSQVTLLREYGEKNNDVRKIIASADRCCVIRPVSVTDKNKLTFEPDKHYFCNIGQYWWPDSLNSGKYVNRDGIVNPESKLYDNTRVSDLISRCKDLSLAFYITGEEKYYYTFVNQLRVWFIDKETYMYPTFEYAQVVPGQNANRGRSAGMISAYGFNDLIESIRLVHGVKKVDRRIMRGVKNWFRAFAEDSEKRYGEKFRSVNNNISLAFDVTMANMYLFAGKEKRAKVIVDEFALLRIAQQILDDGSQPMELQRSKAFSYSIYNLTHVVDLCYLARYWYPNYYLEHCEKIDKAFDFLGQYMGDPESFPYKEISPWNSCKKDYYKQLARLEQLKRN